jgi:hypothetical protein
MIAANLSLGPDDEALNQVIENTCVHANSRVCLYVDAPVAARVCS